MNDKVLKESLWFQALPKEYQESFLRSTNPTKESPQNPTLWAVELPKSSKTPQTKKEPQIIVSVRRSLQNLCFSKLTMEEKGKTVTIESDEEDEGSPTYVEEINLDEETI